MKAKGAWSLEDDPDGLMIQDRYRLLERLGAGGMGTIYLGRDERLGRHVVVKVPHRRLLAEEGFAERFQRETQSLIHLDHPNIVQAFDAGIHDGIPYVVLQYIGEGSLSDRLAAYTTDQLSSDLAQWLPAIAEALDFIHDERVVHRDVKPSNILFGPRNAVFLADFGIAKAMATGETGLTRTGLTPGSPNYMAPEQALGEPLTGAVDQYALAVIAYQVLTGELPFVGKTPLAVILRKSTETPIKPTQLTAHVSPAASQVVMRALSRRPEDRYDSCAEFAAALISAMDAPYVQSRLRTRSGRSTNHRLGPPADRLAQADARPARERLPQLSTTAVAAIAIIVAFSILLLTCRG